MARSRSTLQIMSLLNHNCTHPHLTVPKCTLHCDAATPNPQTRHPTLQTLPAHSITHQDSLITNALSNTSPTKHQHQQFSSNGAQPRGGLMVDTTDDAKSNVSSRSSLRTSVTSLMKRRAGMYSCLPLLPPLTLISAFHAIEPLEAPDFKRNASNYLIRQRAVERERSREASQYACREATPLQCHTGLV
jgi:hypothetical protein